MHAISFPDPAGAPAFPPPSPPPGGDGTAPPPPPGVPRRDLAIGIGVVAALVALLAGTLVWRVARDDSDRLTAFVDPSEVPDALGGSTTSSVPDGQWPAEVLPLVRFVEENRGAPFDHAVPIEFLPEQEYQDSITAQAADTTPEDEAETAAWEGQMRALGLLGGDGSVDDAVDQLTGEGTLAYYDTEDDTIRVLGTELDVAHRVTLVHELTHAWQAQQGYLDGFDDLDPTDSYIVQTLVEGDAMRIEYLYVGDLSRRDYQDYVEQSSDAAAAADLTGVPDFLQAAFFSPYAIGQPLVDLLDADGGNDTVDEALTDPPLAEADLMVPSRWFDGVTPLDVAVPAVPAGAEQLDAGTFGAVSWLIVLSQQLDPRDGLDLVDGWGGDQYVVYRQGDRTCTAVSYRGDDAAATELAATHLDAWAAAMAGHDASVERAPEAVTVRSCEAPGGGEVPARSQTALDYPAIRLAAMAEAVGVGATLDEAFCFGDTIVRQLSFEEVSSGAVYDAERMGSLGAEASTRCQVG